MFARTHLNRDFVTVLVYFPADRFGPETRRKVRETITGYWPGEIVGRDDRIVELGPGPHAVPDRAAPRAADARRRPPHGRGRGRARSPGGGATTWPTCSTSPWASEEADPLLPPLRAALARGLQGGLRRLDRRRRHRRAGGACPTTTGSDFAVYTPPADDGADRRLKVFRTGQAAVARPRAADLRADGHRGARRAPLRDRAAPTAPRPGSTTSGCGCRPAAHLDDRRAPSTFIDDVAPAVARARSSRTASTRWSRGPA